MQFAIRIIVGLAGLLGILLGARFFHDPAAAATLLGVTPAGELGIATLRGDFGPSSAFAEFSRSWRRSGIPRHLSRRRCLRSSSR
jgi:hypothetical protein